MLYGLLWSFGHQLGRRCSRNPRSLSVSKPSTRRTPEAATTADRTDSQAKRKEPWAGSNSPATPTNPAAAPGLDAPHGRLPRAHSVPVRYPQIQPARPRGTSQHYPLRVGVKAPKAACPQAPPALQPLRWAPKPLRPHSGGKVRARLSAQRRDAEPEPVKGGAGGRGRRRRGRARAGGRARSAPKTHPAVVPEPRPGGAGGGQPLQRLRAPRVQWAPIVTALAPPLGVRLRSEPQRSAPSAQREVAGDTRFKEGPRGASAWVPEYKGTPPAPWTPALNLLRPPLLVPTSRSSPARLGRRGRVTLEEGGHLTAPTLPGPGSPSHSWPRLRGKVVFCQFPARSLWSCCQNPESGFSALETPGAASRASGHANSRRCRFFQSRGRCFLSRGVPNETCLKLGQAGGGGPRSATRRKWRSCGPGSLKFRPWRHLRPPVIPPTAGARPAPPPGGPAWTPLINFLNPSPSLPSRVLRLG